MTNKTTTPSTLLVVGLDRKVRQYLEAIKPYQQIRYELYSMMLPTTTMYPDGRIEHDYHFTEHQQETLRLAEEMIESIKQRMGLMPNAKITGSPKASPG